MEMFISLWLDNIKYRKVKIVISGSHAGGIIPMLPTNILMKLISVKNWVGIYPKVT